MKNTVVHTAKVIQCDDHCVDVLLKPQSACGSCHARKICGMEEGGERVLSVVTHDAGHYEVGGDCKCCYLTRHGDQSRDDCLRLSFLLVFILLLILLQAGVSELIAGVSGLAVLAIYYWVLYCLRSRIEKEIQFTISKIVPEETNE